MLLNVFRCQLTYCERRGGRPGLSVLTSLLVSVDLKLYWIVLRHWSQLVPNMSNDIWGHQATLPTYRHTPPPPPPPPSLISLVVSVDVKHHFIIIVLCFPADPLCSDSRMRLSVSDCSFTQRVFCFCLFRWISTDSGYSDVWLLRGWCHLKLLPSRRMFCVHYTSMHQFTVSLYSKSHTWGACGFSCNLPPALLAEWPGSFTCYCGKTG